MSNLKYYETVELLQTLLGTLSSHYSDKTLSGKSVEDLAVDLTDELRNKGYFISKGMID